MKIAQFFALVFTALALAPGGAHLFALPNKIHLDQADYFVTQGIYRGWAWLGIVLIGAILADAAAALAVRGEVVPFALAIVSAAMRPMNVPSSATRIMKSPNPARPV